MPGLSDQLLSQLSDRVADQLGLYFAPERWCELERGIQAAASEVGCSEATAWARSLLSAPLSKHQIETLASQLTIGETYFFREKRSFEILGEQVLPDLIRERQGGQRRLRVWSAGCCTGEEPYSIAILLDRLLPAWHEWRVTILATDVNPHFLRKAAAGVFGEWSFRDAPPWLKEQYFKQIADHRFEILPRMRERVTFAHLNVAQDTYPSLATDTNAMDLIFCRNVLMYFAPERAARAIENFHRALVENGWLFVSPSDAPSELFGQFASMPFDGTMIYRKRDGLSPTLTSARRSLVPAIPIGEAAAGARFSAVAPVAPPAQSMHPAAAPPEPAPIIEQQGPAIEARFPPYEQALALFERGRYLDAASVLRANSSSLSGAAKSLALLARVCANLGELAEARSWADKALTADKLDAGLHYLRATILQEEGSNAEATASLKRALYLMPDFVLAHFALGNLAQRQGTWAEAERHFSNALALLKRYSAGELLPHSDGLAAGQLDEIIQSSLHMSGAA